MTQSQPHETLHFPDDTSLKVAASASCFPNCETIYNLYQM